MMLIENIKQQIVARAKNKNLTTHGLEHKANLKRGSVSNILNGRSSNPTIETLHAISIVLECTVDNLISKLDEEAQNIEKRKSVTHELTNGLLIEILKHILTYKEKKKFKMTMETALYCTQEAYIYCIAEKDYAIDKKFIEWLVNKNTL